ncbi:hypothetical protein PtB15_17B9 [Puccinia triticina]|nr:hypothetical protein PtB15_17B9 [Puccinia triticina]
MSTAPPPEPLPATDSSESDSEKGSRHSSSTPPPTAIDHAQNIATPLAPPSFYEFALQHKSVACPASLTPAASILPMEIQEITPEEFSRSIEAATRSADHILALKLPRTCKRVAEELAATLTQSKRQWQETGAVPHDEDIKITIPGDPLASTLNPPSKTASSQSAPSAGHRVPLPTPDSASKNLSAETDSRGTGPGSAPDPAADRLHSPGLEKATSPSLFKPASPAPGTTASASVQQDSTTSATPLNTQQSTTSTAGTAMHSPAPPSPTPPLQRTDCSYGLWIHTITSLADKFLSPSQNKQWYCPDQINFPKLTAFGDKRNSLEPGSFIPTVNKTEHPESTLVRCLSRLLHPPQRLHIDWARIVAASVELMADNLFKPPQVSSIQAEDHLSHGVEALSFLEAVKNLSSSFDQASSDPGAPAAPRLHSVDVLHKFRNVIIDMLMAYIIFQTHALSKAPLTAAEKKANNRSNRAPIDGSTTTTTSVQTATSELVELPADAAHQLQKYQRKQNFQPLVYFVLAGVRGLFITSRDHRIAGISTCMSFLQAMSIIKDRSTTPHTPDEPIWKTLSAYLYQIFLPVFQSPNKICPLPNVQVPTRFELAEAITKDFLNQWQAWNPTSPFLLPNANPQITNT